MDEGARFIEKGEAGKAGRRRARARLAGAEWGSQGSLRGLWCSFSGQYMAWMTLH